MVEGIIRKGCLAGERRWGGELAKGSGMEKMKSVLREVSGCRMEGQGSTRADLRKIRSGVSSPSSPVATREVICMYCAQG